MANTSSLAALRAKLWYKELFADVPSMLFMNRFMGEGPNNPIQVIRDQSKQAGEYIEFGLSTKLSGDGIEGDDELEGNEEEILTYQDELHIDQLRHAVRLKGRMDEKKVAYGMRKDAKEKLKIWWAERIDREILWKLSGYTTKDFANTPTSPSSGRAIWSGDAGADDSLTAAMVMDTKVLDAAKELALTVSPKVRPIKMSGSQETGEAKYIVIMHPYQFSALRKDPVWNQVQREAGVRGSSNPLFSGAVAEYNGLIIYQHELAYYYSNSGSVTCARALLLGQQAGIMGIGEDERWTEEEKDYKNKWGIAAGRIFGVIKPVFNSEDYGMITIATAAAKATTA
jgi:N4-gp56 family major capsid protein